jgi:hypothetical protein
VDAAAPVNAGAAARRRWRGVNGTASLSLPGTPHPARPRAARPKADIPPARRPGLALRAAPPSAARSRRAAPLDGAAGREEISETEGLICDWS